MKDDSGFVGFDIETEGLIPSGCELVSWCAGDVCKIQGYITDELELIRNLKTNVRGYGLLTFMGGTTYGPGFDFPFLRTRCAILGVPWPFTGVPHIDIYPIIKKRFDTKISYSPGLEDLTVDELKAMMKSFDIVSKAKKKQGYINAITTLCGVDQIGDYITDNCEVKTKEVNNLKGIFQILTGEDPGDMRGGDVPVLWKQWQETHDNTILDEIKEYNQEDCRKTEILWELIQGCCPNRDFVPEVL